MREFPEERRVDYLEHVRGHNVHKRPQCPLFHREEALGYPASTLLVLKPGLHKPR